MAKGDWSNNKTVYKTFYSHLYQVIDEDTRVTTYSTNSPLVNGVRKYRENSINRQWTSHKGIPLMIFTMQQYPNQPLSTSLISAGGFGRGVMNGSLLTDLKQEALNSALDHFHTNASNRQLALMEYILERAKTQRTLINAFKAIVKLRRDLTFKRLFKNLKFYNKRTGKIEFKRVEMSLAEKWLAYNFMWKPLINDVYTLINGFTPVKSSPIRTRGSVSTTTTENFKSYSSLQVRTSTYDVRASVVGSVIITDPLLAVLDEIGLADPGKIIWDAIPFSFVVDWFYNIGSIIDTASSPGKAFYGTSVTYLVKFTSHSSGHTILSAPAFGSVSSLGSGVISKIVTYDRVPGPLPRIRLQLLGGINSAWHLATAYSLGKVLGLLNFKK